MAVGFKAIAGSEMGVDSEMTVGSETAVGTLTCCTTTSVKLSCKAMIISCSPVRNRSDSTSF